MKKIFKISANENTLWTLAAMLDFKSAPKTQSGRGPSNEHFWQVGLKSVLRHPRWPPSADIVLTYDPMGKMFKKKFI
jgi:hypothetical protein